MTKKEFYFQKGHYPPNYERFQELRGIEKSSAEYDRLGVVTYEGLYSNKELAEIEKNADITEELTDSFLPGTAQ